MNGFPAISSIRKIFFTPVDQNKIDQMREQHDQKVRELNIMNLR